MYSVALSPSTCSARHIWVNGNWRITFRFVAMTSPVHPGAILREDVLADLHEHARWSACADAFWTDADAPTIDR